MFASGAIAIPDASNGADYLHHQAPDEQVQDDIPGSPHRQGGSRSSPATSDARARVAMSAAPYCRQATGRTRAINAGARMEFARALQDAHSVSRGPGPRLAKPPRGVARPFISFTNSVKALHPN